MVGIPGRVGRVDPQVRSACRTGIAHPDLEEQWPPVWLRGRLGVEDPAVGLSQKRERACQPPALEPK